VRKRASYAEILNLLSLQLYFLQNNPSTYHVFMAYLDSCFDNIKTRKNLWKNAISFTLSQRPAEKPPSGGIMSLSICQNASCVPKI
jgi:hypothetical protein